MAALRPPRSQGLGRGAICHPADTVLRFVPAGAIAVPAAIAAGYIKPTLTARLRQGEMT
jgi:hypothetical protein